MSPSSLLRHPAEELVTLILIAGTHTVSPVLNASILRLIQHRSYREALFASTATAEAIVDETLRMPLRRGAGRPSGPILTRYSNVDHVIADAYVRHGDLVVLNTGAANLDAHRFAQPDEFQPSRRPNRHLAFGYGPRRCPGANVAKMEIVAALRSLFTAFPDVSLAESEARVLSASSLGASIDRLPVRLNQKRVSDT